MTMKQYQISLFINDVIDNINTEKGDIITEDILCHVHIYHYGFISQC